VRVQGCGGLDQAGVAVPVHRRWSDPALALVCAHAGLVLVPLVAPVAGGLAQR
jgi:hypothetical protein